jgi:hypothetical protein
MLACPCAVAAPAKSGVAGAFGLFKIAFAVPATIETPVTTAKAVKAVII